MVVPRENGRHQEATRGRDTMSEAHAKSWRIGTLGDTPTGMDRYTHVRCVTKCGTTQWPSGAHTL